MIRKLYFLSIVSLFFLFHGSLLIALDQLEKTYVGYRRYNEVCWLTAHNAFANAPDGWKYCQQYYGFEQQYEFGVRSFMLDLHWYGTGVGQPKYVALCHEFEPNDKGFCPLTRVARLFKAPPVAFESYLRQIKGWLDTNRKVIITLHLENYLGSDGKKVISELLHKEGLTDYVFHIEDFENVELETYDREYFDKNGIEKVETRTFISQWPTLNEMRAKNRRLVVFTDNMARGVFSEHIIPVGSAYRETKFDLDEFPKCEMRASGREPEAPLFVMNHFPKLSLVKTLVSCTEYFYLKKYAPTFNDKNSYESIMNRVNECYQQEHILPNFIAVDFVELGDNGGPKRVVTELNQRPPEEFHPIIEDLEDSQISEGLNEENDQSSYHDEL